MFGLALLKNEEYTLHLALLGSHTLHSLKMEHRSAAFFSNCTIGTYGTIRRIVYARPSGVIIYSLQIVYKSANYFSNGTDLNLNGTNREIAYARLSSSLQMVYQWIEQLSIRTNGANRKASLTNGDFLPMVPLVRVS